MKEMGGKYSNVYMNCKRALRVLQCIVFQEMKARATGCHRHSVLSIIIFFENEGLGGTLWERCQKEVL